MPNTALAGLHAQRSHNLSGQRLGRKGRDTRGRVLAALYHLLATSPDAHLSLTAVAREAGVGLTTLYLYFADMGELLLAALEPVESEAQQLIDRHCHHWADDIVHDECLSFLKAHYRFWAKHSRILHIRNSFADAGDKRMLESRRAMSNPAIACIARQLGRAGMAETRLASDHGIVLLTMLERMATITTDANIGFAPVSLQDGTPDAFVMGLIEAEASIMTLTIDHFRRGLPGGR